MATLCVLLAWSVNSSSAGGNAVAANADPPPHHARRGFQNPYLSGDQGGAIRYWFARLFGEVSWAAFSAEDYSVPIKSPELSHSLTIDPQVTWIGQATVLVQYHGVTVLTDPMFSAKASPVRFAGPSRISEPGVKLHELPAVDLVVLSHDHYDHLDEPSIRSLGDDPVYAAPLGVDRWLVKHSITSQRVHGLDWWQSTELVINGAKVTLTATPAQHVSGRGLLDRNQRLWASWSITIDDFKFFFAGDTGYNPIQFREIGERAGPFDLALLPIGSYAPRTFMSAVHVDPSQALQISEDVRARTSLAIHWGTFFLTAEHPAEPPSELAKVTLAAAFLEDQLAIFGIGETRRLVLNDDSSGCALVTEHWCYLQPSESSVVAPR